MSKLSEDVKLTTLNEHYNSTVADFKELGKSRERNFLAILVLLGVMAFQFISPNQSKDILTQFVQNQLNIDVSLSINIIGSLVWFSLLYVSIKYFQTVINIEKQYNYTHKLEAELSKNYDEEVFTREGKAYLNNYPIFSEWVHILYWYIFPALFFITITAKIIGEYLVSTDKLPFIFNAIIYLCLVISTGLYVYSLVKSKKNTEDDLNHHIS